MLAALIDTDGVVINRILVGEGYVPPDGLTLAPCPAHVGIGWRLGPSGAWTAPDEPHGKPHDEPERRLVPKSLIIARLTDAQLDAALALMTTRQKERWRAPDHPAVYADDPEAVALLTAVGADPALVLGASLSR